MPLMLTKGATLNFSFFPAAPVLLDGINLYLSNVTDL